MNILNTPSLLKCHKLKRCARAAAILAIIATLAMPSSPAHARDYQFKTFKIDHIWARVTIPGRPAAGYMTVHNQGKADKIISAHSPAVKNIELHTVSMKDGVMRMRPVKHIAVPAGGQVALKSGGFHLMMFGIKPSVKPGSTLPITVVFEKAGAVTMEFIVKKSAKSMKHSGHGTMKKMNH